MYPVATMCPMLGVATRAYCAWQGRAPLPRVESDRALLDRVREIYLTSPATYDTPRIHAELVDRDRAMGRNRIARSMRCSFPHFPVGIPPDPRHLSRSLRASACVMQSIKCWRIA